ncbi:hypothetical protein CAPTEDRAFT_225461 [Capitella teleta]|uniref:AAA+ ATPase domain-containing protein n=1 Tax=Capitella teleta TaxID=283909 RepID=R7TSU1_CAPTE|nr:hypothetical protein CAPTEDRAFT_225461 [Capitella teleta]|eukprot:ELT94551.1 hypothetical protein CAPTEDRAFT_225461 [Capitella teleta]
MIESSSVKSRASASSIVLLKPKPAKHLSIAVVIDQCSERDNLVHLVKQTLHNHVVTVHQTIICASVIANLHGVKQINIQAGTPSADALLVVKSTDISIASVVSLEKHRQMIKQNDISPLGGLKLQHHLPKDLIEINFNLSNAAFRNGIDLNRVCLIIGPSGCGKTSLVKQVAMETNAHLMVSSGNQILGSRPGESEGNLREMYAKAVSLSEEGPCVWFLDDIEGLASGKGSAEGRVSTQLAAILDELHGSKNGNLVVLAATNQPNTIDKIVRRRIDKEIAIGVPRLEDRLDALQLLTKQLSLSSQINLCSIAEATPGYLGADLKALIHHAVHNSLCRHNYEGSVIVEAEDLEAALHAIVPSTQRHSDITADFKPTFWKDIGGLDDVKNKIKQAVEWPLKMGEAFRRLGIPCPKGVLLYGPPGCAKTTLVRAAATSCHVTFLAVSCAQLYSPFVGDSEKKIAEVFQQARAGAPSILFLDEVDSLVGNRFQGNSKGGSSVQERVLSTLLNQMDGVRLRSDEAPQLKIKEGESVPASSQSQQDSISVDNSQVLVVAATNRPDMLDDALLRPGRFDRLIYVPPPDQKARVEILKIHRQRTPMSENVDVEAIALQLDGFTGADTENICREAALLALTVDGIGATEVNQSHFDRVLKEAQPSLSTQQLLSYSQIKSQSS